MKRTLILDSHFTAAHFYKNDTFTEKENKKHFGKCFTEHGHGHDYKLEVGFRIPLTLTEVKLNKSREQLQQHLKKLIEGLDYKHLNFDISEFKTTVPTTENILLYFEKKISRLSIKNQLIFIKLFETKDLWSEKYYVTE